MSPPLLDASSLTRRFGGLAAVDGVSLSLARGTLHAVIGPNGAGKSSLVNLLSGALRPSAGRIAVAGVDLTAAPPWKFARAGVGRSFQRTNVLPEMSVLENARLAAQVATTPAAHLLRNASRAEAPIRLAREALDRVGLADQPHRLAGALSHGQARQLELAMVLATKPAILLLDEPLAGMGPEEAHRIAALVRALAADHALLLIEHDMDVVFAIADRVTVMVDGRVLDDGTPAHIRASPAVRDAYLGHAA